MRKIDAGDRGEEEGMQGRQIPDGRGAKLHGRRE
jgi:hypothetical protein